MLNSSRRRLRAAARRRADGGAARAASRPRRRAAARRGQLAAAAASGARREAGRGHEQRVRARRDSEEDGHAACRCHPQKTRDDSRKVALLLPALSRRAGPFYETVNARTASRWVCDSRRGRLACVSRCWCSMPWQHVPSVRSPPRAHQMPRYTLLLLCTPCAPRTRSSEAGVFIAPAPPTASAQRRNSLAAVAGSVVAARRRDAHAARPRAQHVPAGCSSSPPPPSRRAAHAAPDAARAPPALLLGMCCGARTLSRCGCTSRRGRRSRRSSSRSAPPDPRPLRTRPRGAPRAAAAAHERAAAPVNTRFALAAPRGGFCRPPRRPARARGAELGRSACAATC